MEMLDTNWTTLIFTTTETFNGSTITHYVTGGLVQANYSYFRFEIASLLNLPDREFNDFYGFSVALLSFDTTTWSNATVQVSVDVDHSNTAGMAVDYGFVILLPARAPSVELSPCCILWSSVAAPGPLPLVVGATNLGGKSWVLAFYPAYNQTRLFFDATSTVVNYVVEVFMTR